MTIKMTDMPGRISKNCLQCGIVFNIPRCRDWREQCCSSSCKSVRAVQIFSNMVFERARNCATCGQFFIPRKTQLKADQGKFCSKQCGIRFNHLLLHTPAVKASRVEGLKRSIAEGRTTYKTGPENPSWAGGREASNARAKPKMAANQRAYRERNPEKVREWSQKRKGLKTGRLPRGTVVNLFHLQRGKCAVCKCCLKAGFHLDHIEPLARGGLHVVKNIQLLCPTCNVRKGAKDPITFMQSKGFLL
jgi:5-methylcytosine-specific restriction endonuclease McrA